MFFSIKFPILIISIFVPVRFSHRDQFFSGLININHGHDHAMSRPLPGLSPACLRAVSGLSRFCHGECDRIIIVYPTKKLLYISKFSKGNLDVRITSNSPN